MKNASTERADVLRALLGLAAALYGPPREALRDDLEAGRVRRLTGEVAAALDMPSPRWEDTGFETLQTRYVALFVTHPGGVPAPPYAGYALDDTLLGESVQALQEFLSRYGFSLSEGWRDLPDHVALLAEAGGVLLDTEQYDEALELTRRFLLPWFTRYAPPLGAADPDVYGPLTQFLHRALEEVACEVAA